MAFLEVASMVFTWWIVAFLCNACVPAYAPPMLRGVRMMCIRLHQMMFVWSEFELNVWLCECIDKLHAVCCCEFWDTYSVICDLTVFVM